VLASDAVQELAGATDGVAFGFRRVERLKGFEKPVGVVEVHPAEHVQKRELARSAKAKLGGSRPKRRLLIAALIALVAVAVAVPVALLSGGGESAAASVLKQDSIRAPLPGGPDRSGWATTATRLSSATTHSTGRS
jgi:hypothetical protein